MSRHATLKKAADIAIPIALGGGILWWMYRGADLREVAAVMAGDLKWGWMLVSLAFGVAAPLFRGLRWRQTLEPLGERPRVANCVHAVFISYASSLIIPRSGELSRCAVLSKYDSVSFMKSLGTVVTERVIDVLLMMAIAAIVALSHVRVFTSFLDHTGTDLTRILSGFSATGYAVTALIAVVTAGFLWIVMAHLTVMAKAREMWRKAMEGALSLKDVRRKWLFALYTLAIWASYFLQYWVTFKCFDFTAGLHFNAAIVSFIAGSFAVIVPTPNGAGPWHFAVKTILILYGLGDTDAVTFVLIVHAIHTALVPLLGVFSLTALGIKGTVRPPICPSGVKAEPTRE